MSDLNDKVLETKNALMSALGDNVQKYLNHMKFWFRHKWTKEEFDAESRKLLTPDKMHLHNQFLLAILNKIDAFSVPQNSQPIGSYSSTNSSRSSKKRKRSSKLFYDRATFEPYDLYSYLFEENLDFIRPPNTKSGDSPPPVPQQRYCVQELFLPDAGFVMGRLLVGAWESGLVNVDDVAAEYLAVAVQTLLKNVITAIIMKRKHYRVTGDGAFFYDVGAPIKDPFVRNTVTRQKIDDAPLELDKEISSVNIQRKANDETVFLSACEELYPQKRQIITLKDVYKALQDKNIIQSHSVYSINMERITQMLH